MFVSLVSEAHGISVDCPDIINLAKGLYINLRQPSIWSALQIDCCATSGITCDGNQRVSQINWSNMALYGTINGTALPSELIRLYLYTDYLSGTLPKSFPSKLEVLHLAHNPLLSGSIPSLPSGLTYLNIFDCRLTENIPTLPSGLLYLDLSHNKLSGSIPAIPNGLKYLHLHDNQLSGDVPPMPPSVNDVCFGYPGEPGNHFTGSLVLYQTTHVLINYNWITDLIIQDAGLLVACQVSDNPLLGNPHLVNLTICIQNNLFNASLLPMTISSTTLRSSSTHAPYPTSNAASGTLSSIYANIFTALFVNETTISTSIATSIAIDSTLQATGTFKLILNALVISLSMVLRLTASLIVLILVLWKTPLTRGIKKFVKKSKERNKKMTTSQIEV